MAAAYDLYSLRLLLHHEPSGIDDNDYGVRLQVRPIFADRALSTRLDSLRLFLM